MTKYDKHEFETQKRLETAVKFLKIICWNVHLCPL